MKLVSKEIEEIEPASNPSEYSSLAKDAIAFGGGAVITNIILESVTMTYMTSVPNMQKQNTGYMVGGVKILVGLLAMWASSKYVSSGMWKKLGYGVSVGFFVSASNDIIEAIAYVPPVVAAVSA